MGRPSRWKQRQPLHLLQHRREPHLHQCAICADAQSKLGTVCRIIIAVSIAAKLANNRYCHSFASGPKNRKAVIGYSVR